MKSKRIHRRTREALPIMWAAFACADVVDEGIRRLFEGVVTEHVSGRVFVSIGRAIQSLMRTMLDADARYQALRQRQRQRQTRRDQIVKRLYGELRDARRFFKSLLGKEDDGGWLTGAVGPTERDPLPLLLQTRNVTHSLSKRNAWPDSARQHPLIDALASKLTASAQDLEDALDAILDGRAETLSAMFDQREAMQHFDRMCKEGGQILQDQLCLAGLPTLADAVRPGVGRLGRPLKHRPVDSHPDLVAKVCEAGMVDALNRPASRVENSAPAENGIEALSRPSSTARDGSAPLGENSTALQDRRVTEAKVEHTLHKRPAEEEKNQHPLHKRSASEEKSQHPLHKRSESEEKSQHPFHKRSASEEKSQHPLHKRTATGEKSEHPFHNLPRDPVNLSNTTLSASKRDATSGRRYPRSSAELRRTRLRNATRRPTAPSGPEERDAAETPNVGPVRRAASALWQRLRAK